MQNLFKKCRKVIKACKYMGRYNKKFDNAIAILENKQFIVHQNLFYILEAPI